MHQQVIFVPQFSGTDVQVFDAVTGKNQGVMHIKEALNTFKYWKFNTLAVVNHIRLTNKMFAL